ncbi:putative urea ABC transporter substrate-binding protein [Terrihabitans rhizophilus]|uniref:Urea ABC transporter substrate-binding protein n=1 Tax=Terrihabitans rhizophilus TaxID=3092662 RepID=A0ABU4RL09_9HYPH|nr:putative urea ABC transporter substrate-binding protein [Terrihabitans sp. PJ23]MDX6804903.1 putative urea ABC transporter substrate-binding protein [Terrihabitans sp. PJ23]
MRTGILRWFGALSAAAVFAATLSAPAAAAPKKEFKVGWSIYVGWVPWQYAEDSGILKKWADKYGLTVDVVQINDYVESVNQFTAGQFDGVTVTNGDALAIPAAGGVDSTALILGDYSNGNDAVILKGKKSLADIKGQQVNLVELSVSHYLMARALETVGLSEKDVTVVNTSDADMIAVASTPDVTAVVTWNPLVSEIKALPGMTAVFDSSKIPMEIIDMLLVNTEALNDNPDFGKALAGAWYETLAALGKGGEAREAMAKLSGSTPESFDDQLKTTKLYSDPKEAVAFARDPALVEAMDRVRKFSFSHGLLGEGAKSPDEVGMSFPGGKTLGNAGNVKLRFDDTYMNMAATGAL